MFQNVKLIMSKSKSTRFSELFKCNYTKAPDKGWITWHEHMRRMDTLSQKARCQIVYAFLLNGTGDSRHLIEDAYKWKKKKKGKRKVQGVPQSQTAAITVVSLLKMVANKAGTINRIIDWLIDKFHKNNYHYRFASNLSFNFCLSYFTVFTLSIQTPQLLTILNLKFEQV